MNVKKFKFKLDFINYLGHIISIDIVTMDSTKTEAIEKSPTPTSIKSL